MTLAAGDRLGRYEILAPLGAGGMGEVYRARDTTLDREVAVKVLAEPVAQDPDRLERFEREAKAVATLSHPNILDIHDFGHEGAVAYAVAELLEGETLKDRLGASPLGWRAAAAIGAEIADGLAAAHGRGVVHRDLKPGNVFLTRDGRVKILDFGLARITEPAAEEVVTRGLDSTLTREGAVLGTAGYMSPEQVRGQKADHRSDIFSLGCVLYEMVTGRRAFERESGADTMSAILTEEPAELSASGTEVSIDLERIAQRCLHKQPNARFQSAADLAFALRTAGSASEARRPVPASPSSAQRTRRDLLAAAVGALMMAVVVTGAVVLLRGNPPPSRPFYRFTVPLPEPESFPKGLAVSPDGSRLVWAGSRLYQRRLDRLEELQAIPDTDGASHPFFSPDGRWLCFNHDGKLNKMSLDGGLAVPLADSHWRSRASWGLDDFIVFTDTNRGISRISSHGGEPIVLTATEPGTTYSHASPQLLPASNVLLYHRHHNDPTVVARRLDTGEDIELIQGRYPRYLPTGHLIFTTRPALVARPFDPDSLQFTGPSRPVLEGIWPRDQVAVSDSGVLAYLTVPTGQLVWVDHDGAASPAVSERRWYSRPRLSSNQRHIAVTIADEIWIYDLRRDTFNPIDAPGWNMNPVWTPDGEWVTLSSDRAGWGSIESHAVDGSGRTRLLIGGYPEDGGDASSWSPDGRHLMFIRGAGDWMGTDIWVLPADEDREPFLFVGTEAEETCPYFSPDGRWILYCSNRSGTYEIYVTDFPDRARTIQISTGGGVQALWAPDGQSIYYRFGDRMMKVPIDYTPSVEAGRPEILFTGDFGGWDSRCPEYDITADGARFLMLRDDPGEIVVVTDWFDELKLLAPAD